MVRPLADELRPQTLDEVVGQSHILGVNGMLRRIVNSGRLPNMIFYGPSGTGKTTVANIIAKTTDRALRHLNATTASASDVKEIIEETNTIMAPNGILLYLDEIQYFNKKQQQLLLDFIESGKISLIASTTENPYFYVYNAVLSRCTVFEFRQVEPEDVEKALKRGVKYLEEKNSVSIDCSSDIMRHLAYTCGGDVRKALGVLELLYAGGRIEGGCVHMSMEDAETATGRSAMRYDIDSHYDILSALQKSIRGSDPDAAIHYLARLLEAGDLVSPCRRLLVIAAEDIGLAYPQAIAIVKACVDSAIQVGLPEARIPLADAVILLATAPKSNSGNAAIGAAMSDVKAGKVGEIPRHLKNVHADGAEVQKVEPYKYAHSYKNHYVEQQYFPDSLVGTVYYKYGENKTEQAAKKYWEAIKGKK